MKKGVYLIALTVTGMASATAPFFPNKDNHFVYGNPIELAEKYLPNDFYKRAISTLPIVCVDIVVVNTNTYEYLLILRNNEPAKGLFWVPGGRLYKGESFFEAAQRKCKEEINITVKPLSLLSINSLYFESSEWGCSTHTPTVGIVALFNPQEAPLVNKDHAGYRWISLFDEYSDDPYIEKLRQEALKHLKP